MLVAGVHPLHHGLGMAPRALSHFCGAALVSDIIESQSPLAGAGMGSAHGQPPQVLWCLTPAGPINAEHHTYRLRGTRLKWECQPPVQTPSNNGSQTGRGLVWLFVERVLAFGFDGTSPSCQHEEGDQACEPDADKSRQNPQRGEYDSAMSVLLEARLKSYATPNPGAFLPRKQRLQAL
jgi:hypothetical protein